MSDTFDIRIRTSAFETHPEIGDSEKVELIKDMLTDTKIIFPAMIESVALAVAA